MKAGTTRFQDKREAILDGAATMAAALLSLRQRKPARLICAVPVASHEALALVRHKGPWN